MKTDTPSLETPQAARLRRRQLIRQLLERDKTPLAILFMAAVVGTLVGLAAVAFDKGVAWLQNQRMGALVHTADNYPLLLTVAFLCSAVLAMFGYFLVRKYAPEAGGSGIPEIEGALEDQRPVRWWRVLPVKFFGGLGTLGGGMVLGREGPTVQIGGNIGRMVLDIFRLKGDEARHTLLATGAAAGLAAALFLSRRLNILALGDEVAAGLGIRVERTRLLLLTSAAGERLGLTDLLWDDLIRSPYLGILGEPDVDETRVGRSSLDTELSLEDGIRMKVHAGPGLINGGKQDPEVKFILDGDFSRTGNLTADKVPGTLEELHHYAVRFFQGAILPELHEAMGPVPMAE